MKGVPPKTGFFNSGEAGGGGDITGEEMMKSRNRFFLWRLAVLAIVGAFAAGSSAQLINNGSFEDDPLGTTLVVTTNGVIDSTTFTAWRMYSVGEPPAPFTATIVSDASDGNQAMRLDFTDLSIGADHSLDRGGATIPVINTKYTLFFDAAWISGSPEIQVVFAEYGEDGAFLGQQRVISRSIDSPDYQGFSVDWTPLSGDAISLINIAFKQVPTATETSSSILLDNVRFTRSDLPADGLYTPMDSFNKTNHVVSATVFQWYAPTAGQLDGPWLPQEGRPLWTGLPDWWIKQIKQMMMANIDILNVQLIPAYEQERINLFKALNQLRYEGYDVPKVSPFLDSAITWNGMSVDVATAAGKDEFANQYIRFFNQYYGVNQDAAADDYLAKYDDEMLLSVYRVQSVLTNAPSLTRNDITSRLLAEFGTASPFTNAIYMASAEFDDPTIAFSDEKNTSFGELGYFRKSTWAGVDAAMVKPGFWDQNIRNPGNFRPRDGGIHYSDAWNSVNADSSIERVYVETWNEYDEGTGIYAADPTNSPYIKPGSGNTSTDTWSASNDPYEYIRTTAAGAAAFNDVPANDAQIIWNNFPDRMYVGQTQTVSVVVRNAGDASWTAAAGYQFGDKAGAAALFGTDRYLLDDSADEIPIYGGIFRGRPKTFEITLVAPTAPGTYTTRWSMVQDGGAGWFGEEFAKTIEVADIFDIPVEMFPEATPEGYNVVGWLSETGRAYAVSWSPDLVYEPFVTLAEDIRWPQASYTDQTARAGSAGFYQVDVSIVEPAVELIKNPGFEIEGLGGDTDPADWFRTNTAIVQRVGEPGQDGHGDWELLLQDGEDAWHWASQKPPATAGVEYTATIQFKGVMQAGEIAYIYLEWFNSSGGSLGNTWSEYTTADSDYAEWAWVSRSVTATAPAGTTEVEVRVMTKMDGGGNSGIWADNVEFTENN